MTIPTPRYLPVETYRKWSGSNSEVNDDLVAQAIVAAEEHIDAQAGRSLTVVTDATVATARVFAPEPRSRYIWMPDAAEVDSVVENGTTLVAGAGYQLEPLNGMEPSTGAYRPYDRIVRLDGWWYWDDMKPTVTVTAKWGWTSIPNVVVEACKTLAGDWLEHRTLKLGVIGTSVDGFSIGARSSPMVRQAIATVAGARQVLR